MRVQILLPLIFTLSPLARGQNANIYPNSVAEVLHPVSLRDEKGNVVQLNSGPVIVELGTPGNFVGGGYLKITTAQGSAKITLPRGIFASAGKFAVSAADSGQEASLRGGPVSEVTHQNRRDGTLPCTIAPVTVHINNNDGTPAMENVKNTPYPLSVRLCVQWVNRALSIQQLKSDQESCAGAQKVVLEDQTVNDNYVIELLDPANGAVIGKIKSLVRSVATPGKVVNRLTACERLTDS